MSWATPAASDVLSELSTAEASALQTAFGVSPTTQITPVLARVVAEIRGYIQSGGYPLDPTAGNLPAGLVSDCVIITRWRLLTSLPQNETIQSKERKDGYDASMKKMVLIGQRKFGVESPTAGVNPPTGQWNAENKLIMRTHPVPQPAIQITPTGTDYANVNVEDE